MKLSTDKSKNNGNNTAVDTHNEKTRICHPDDRKDLFNVIFRCLGFAQHNIG